MMKTVAEHDRRVAELAEKLSEIEERLIPTGLHVFGRASEFDERADLLRMVASFDRPEFGARALSQIVAAGLHIDSYEELLQQGATSETRDLIDGIVKAAIQSFCERGADAAVQFLKSRANVEPHLSRPTFE